MSENGQAAWVGRAVICTAILAAVAHLDASETPEPCGLLTVHGLTVGSTRGAVRAELGRERSTTRIIRAGGVEATAAEYGVGEAATYVEYDHRINRRPEPRAVLVRTTIPSTPEGVAALVERWGAPAVWQDASIASRASIGVVVVWVDENCGVVATVYRRTGEWWGGAGMTVLQVESLEAVRRGESPASLVLTPPASPPSP